MTEVQEHKCLECKTIFVAYTDTKGPHLWCSRECEMKFNQRTERQRKERAK